MNLTNIEIKKSIVKSQHCQRNWDLSKSICDEDLRLFEHAVTNCPSKQNIAFYDVYFITNRSIIEKIHNNTNGFMLNYQGDYTTNTQVLANLLIVFTDRPIELETQHRNEQLDSIKNNTATDETWKIINRDIDMAVGVAAGYINLLANLKGYSTGCCACFDNDNIKTILNIEKNVKLLMGVGFSNKEMNRRIHHINKDIIFPTKVKQPISVFKL